MTTEAPPLAATAADTRLELTVRGVVMGVLITLVFTAANVYLGLKVALTFSTAIPAAVIRMAEAIAAAVQSYFNKRTVAHP